LPGVEVTNYKFSLPFLELRVAPLDALLRQVCDTSIVFTELASAAWSIGRIDVDPLLMARAREKEFDFDSFLRLQDWSYY
jgi:hypothetical protein